jgi:hypothetical protein
VRAPCRLFVIMASAAPVAAVLRRGPSRACQVTAWDTARDVFTPGAWIKGRLYEDRCDVSPDGELFLYFCFGGRRREGYTDSWTAVSRLPWLHATGLRVASGAPECQPSRTSRCRVDADWSGVDHSGRVVYCKDGKLFRRVQGEDKELMDFNTARPKYEPPPAWAKTPLPRQRR